MAPLCARRAYRDAPGRATQLCIAAGGGIAAAAYIADVSYWPHRLNWLKAVLAIEAALCFGLGVLLYQGVVRTRARPQRDQHTGRMCCRPGGSAASCVARQLTPRRAQSPEAPHVYWAVAMPLAQAALKQAVLPHAPLLQFLRASAYGFAAGGTAVLVAWGIWVASDEQHEWHTAVPLMQHDVHCKLARVLRGTLLLALRTRTADVSDRLPAAWAAAAVALGCAGLLGGGLHVARPRAGSRLVLLARRAVVLRQPLAGGDWARSMRQAAPVCGALLRLHGRAFLKAH